MITKAFIIPISIPFPMAFERHIHLGFLILLLSLATSASAQWNWESPIPQGNTLDDIQFFDTLNGWAVGDYGTALHTTNGGLSWYEQEYGRTDNLLGISMISPDEGWAVGDNGVILHTTDGGDDWLEQTIAFSGGFNAVAFLDSLNGWVVGDQESIFHTTNGGLQWTLQHQSPGPGSMNALTVVSPSDLWAVGSNGKIYHTTDAGGTWIQRYLRVNGLTLSGVAFTDPSTGIVTGSHGVLLETFDGGLNWTSTTIGDSTNLNAIYMQNGSVGWIAGDGGSFYRTINGGASWSRSILGDGSSLNAIGHASGMLLICGELGHISLSRTSGISWSSLDAGSRLSVNWSDFPDPSIGFATGQEGLFLRTQNGGVTWTAMASPSPTTSCYGIKFTDNTHGWAVGDAGAIFRTSDGLTWTTQTSPVSHTLFGIVFDAGGGGWIVGGEYVNGTGVVLHSSDGGGSWQIQYASVPNILYGVSFPTPTTGWAVGEVGTILRTTDGGGSWQPQASGVSSALYWCHFADSTSGWAVGDSGVIVRTTNGGTSWTRQSTGTTVAMYSIATFSPTTAVAVGDSGTVLYTSDGGSTWQDQYSRTTYGIFGVAASDNGVATAVGDYGTILANALQTPGNNTYAYPIGNGWNLISLPLDVADFSRRAVYPSSVSSLFSYNGSGYLVSDTLAFGNGYWLKFGGAQTVWITGPRLAGDTIQVVPGWNLFGNLNDSMPITSLDLNPPNNVESSFFGYINGYGQTQTLLPGKGYWAKFTQAGTMAIHTPSIPPAKAMISTAGDALNSVTFRRDDGAAATVQFGANLAASRVATAAMPPLPPADGFDARYEDGRWLASFGPNATEKLIAFQSPGARLSVSWKIASDDARSYTLTDPATHRIVLSFVKPEGSATVPAPSRGYFIHASADNTAGSLPREYKLYQNSPNPFNPSTTIAFDLPAASRVELRVYNLLGEVVATLVDGIVDAGAHQSTWMPALPSGVYFCRMHAVALDASHRELTDTRKMLLLK